MNYLILKEIPDLKLYCSQSSIFYPTESLWSILNKTMMINSCGLKEILQPMIRINYASVVRADQTYELYKMEIFKINEFCYITGISKEFFLNTSIYEFIKRHNLGDRTFRYCKSCLKEGFHSILHQIIFIEKCPLHQIPLEVLCQKCKKTTTYTFTSLKRCKPFTCKICGNEFCENNNSIIRSKNSFSKRKEVFSISSLWFDKNKSLSDASLNIDFLKNKLSEEVFFKQRKLALIDYWNDLMGINFEHFRKTLNNQKFFYKKKQKKLSILNNNSFDFITTYKSIKRYIFNRFIKSHKKCYNEISRLINCDMLCLNKQLNSEFGCTIVYAFIIWRLYWEYTKNSYDLFRKQNNKMDFNGFSYKHSNVNPWIDINVFSEECIWTFMESFYIAEYFQKQNLIILNKFSISRIFVPYWEAKTDMEMGTVTFHNWIPNLSFNDLKTKFSSKHYRNVKECAYSVVTKYFSSMNNISNFP